jgi:hypothetical protein
MDREIHEESSKELGVYVGHEIGFKFPSFNFVMLFAKPLCIK